MLTRRIIPCLDVREGVVVKGVQFRGHVVLGEIPDFVVKYRDDGADELVFYDITASSENRGVAVQWVEKAAEILDIPFCVAGGIRSLEDARRILNSGADKVSVNSPALEDPDLINRLASEFGSQCVVVGIDSRYEQGNWFVYQYTGNEATARSSRRLTMDWIKEVQERGAGEIVLNCMNSDGVGAGYDIEQLCCARNVTKIPLIASGGAGKTSHFEEVFRVARVDGALAAGVFHRNEITIPALKQALQDSGIQVRPGQMRAI